MHTYYTTEYKKREPTPGSFEQTVPDNPEGPRKTVSHQGMGCPKVQSKTHCCAWVCKRSGIVPRNLIFSRGRRQNCRKSSTGGIASGFQYRVQLDWALRTSDQYSKMKYLLYSRAYAESFNNLREPQADMGAGVFKSVIFFRIVFSQTLKLSATAATRTQKHYNNRI